MNFINGQDIENYSYRDLFVYWYHDVFSMSPMYKNIEQICENSPHHREANVAVHTNMVVSQYLTFIDSMYWDKPWLLGALATAFHDVGKPASRTEKYSEERGTYYSYPGHEQVSARMWENWALKNIHNYFPQFTKRDIYNVGWMIENHLPWGVKKEEKYQALVRTVHHENISVPFKNVLKADSLGRICDDYESIRTRVSQWTSEFDLSVYRENYNNLKRLNQEHYQTDYQTLIMPIGPSGSGKTTLRNDLPYDDVQVFSLDDLRLELYGNDYSEAFKKSTEDKQFNQKAQQRFVSLLKQNNNVYVDNTNLSKKRRKMYLTEAKRKGFKTVAYLFMVDKDTLVKRQENRKDKQIPLNVSYQQFDKLQYPSYGEFDEIVVVD